jgi:hypothetical protein
MTETLVLHRGGWPATKADLAAVPVPDATSSYYPVPYARFVEEVELHIPRFGFTVISSAFGLARDGTQMFGVLTCRNGNGPTDYALAIGLRNSYDRSLAAELVAGHRVFCCDNLAFWGEAGANIKRKHTANVFRDLPELIYRMLQGVSVIRSRMDGTIAAMRHRCLSTELADHLILESIRGGAVPASKLPKVIETWETPLHEEFTPRTAWSLYNAFTEVQKSFSPRQQMEDSLRLTGVFRRVLQLN